MRKNVELLKINWKNNNDFVQQCNNGALCTPVVLEIWTQRTALTNEVCVQYTAREVYIVSELIAAQYTKRVHCQWTHRCTVNLHCTLSLHSQVPCARAVYAFGALNGVHWRWTDVQPYSVHYNCTRGFTVFIICMWIEGTLNQAVQACSTVSVHYLSAFCKRSHKGALHTFFAFCHASKVLC